LSIKLGEDRLAVVLDAETQRDAVCDGGGSEDEVVPSHGLFDAVQRSGDTRTFFTDFN